MASRWTEHETALLAKAFPAMGGNAVARILRRPTTAVWKKAQAIGVSRHGRIRWTAEEDKALNEKYLVKHTTEFAAALNRSPKAISARADQLGLSRKKLVQPIGHERTVSGVTFRKVSLTGNGRQDWKRVEVLEWEQINGPVPDGYTLVLTRGSPRTAENLQLVLIEDASIKAALKAQKKASPDVRGLWFLKGLFNRELRRIEALNGVAPPGRAGKWWTKEERDYLKANYSILPIGDISSHLNRSEEAIRTEVQRPNRTVKACHRQAERLGLRKGGSA